MRHKKGLYKKKFISEQAIYDLYFLKTTEKAKNEKINHIILKNENIVMKISFLSIYHIVGRYDQMHTIGHDFEDFLWVSLTAS